MSVTISPATHEFPQDWGITCYADGEGTWIGGAADYRSALALRAEHLEHCTECVAYGCYTSSRTVGFDVPEVNMANRNAQDMLVLLGIAVEDGLCGGMAAEDFQGRVLVARALAHTVDQALVPITYAEDGGAEYTDCGREAGYLAERLEQLATVAEFAVEHGVEVTWG